MTCRPMLLAVASAVLSLPAIGEMPLGRLFFTASERLALERARAPAGERAAVAAPTLTVNGVVTRNTGKKTVWLDGVAHHDNTSGLAVEPSAEDPSTVSIGAPDKAPAKVRVGSTAVRATGASVDLIGDGRISIDTGR